MSSILRGNDNLDSSNLATDTELSIALAGKANTIVANDSQIKTALNATGTAPIYACRAWVNFNGTGTVAIRASGNVSSITDNGVGDYTVNFTNAMTDENASFAVSGRRTDVDVPAIVSLAYLYVPNVNNVRIISTNNVNDSKIDTNSIFVEAFR